MFCKVKASGMRTMNLRQNNIVYYWIRKFMRDVL